MREETPNLLEDTVIERHSIVFTVIALLSPAFLVATIILAALNTGNIPVFAPYSIWATLILFAVSFAMTQWFIATSAKELDDNERRERQKSGGAEA